jgi:hypothetical protein
MSNRYVLRTAWEESYVAYRLEIPTGLPSNSRDGRVVDFLGISDKIPCGKNVIQPMY